MAQTVQHLPTVWETRVQSLGREDLLEKEVAIHSGILARRIPGTEKPGRLQSKGLQRVRHESMAVMFTMVSFLSKVHSILGFSFP